MLRISGDDLFGRTVHVDPAVVQPEDAIAKLAEHGKVVADHDYGLGEGYERLYRSRALVWKERSPADRTSLTMRISGSMDVATEKASRTNIPAE